jgi:hypothetical protein
MGLAGVHLFVKRPFYKVIIDSSIMLLTRREMSPKATSSKDRLRALSQGKVARKRSSKQN